MALSPGPLSQPAHPQKTAACASVPKPAHQTGAGNAGETVGQALVAHRLHGLHMRQAVEARRQSVEPWLFYEPTYQ